MRALLANLFLIWTCSGFDKNCLQPGACLNGQILGSHNVDSVRDCLELCKSTENCTDFTFLGDLMQDGVCFLDNGCPEISTEACAVDCYSGSPEECLTCYESGICLGQLIGLSLEPNAGTCLQECQKNDLCQWFSFEPEDGACTLTADCNFLDQTCVDCVYGEAKCRGSNDPLTVFVIGGYDGNSVLDDVEALEIGQPQGCSKPPALLTYYESQAYGILDGRVTLCGDYYTASCYAFSPEDQDWLEVGEIDERRSAAAGIVVDIEGKGQALWVTGGVIPSNGNPTSSSVFFFSDGTIEPATNLRFSVSGHCMARLNETHIFMNGGNYEEDVHEEAYLFDFPRREWIPLPETTYTYSFHNCFVIGGTLYTVGGIGSGYKRLEKLTLGVDSEWTTIELAPPMVETKRARSVEYDGTVLLIGGLDDEDQITNKVFEFDPSRDEWILRPETLVTGRDGHAAIAVTPEYYPCGS